MSRYQARYQEPKRCPKCGVKPVIRWTWNGRRVVCPKCGLSMTVAEWLDMTVRKVAHEPSRA